MRCLSVPAWVAAAAVAFAWAGPRAAAQTSPVTQGTVTVKLSPVATVNTGTFGTPQDVVSANDNSGRLFVTTRSGDILVLSNGALQSTPYLNMPAAGISIYTGGEGGLLGMAFSPTFSTPGTFGYEKFYTVNTEPFSTTGTAADFSHPELFPMTSTNPNNQIVLREWSVNSPSATTANATSSRVLLRINHPQNNHQGGSLRFGPDGNLYLGLGDGGGANDENTTATTSTDGHTNSTGNGQDTSVVFGKILRINPNPAAGSGFTASTNGQYATPNTNPFSTSGGLKEIYAYGLRNPYRLSFDSATGKLYVGDVGQGNREEVDSIAAPATTNNFGWPYREGTRDNSADTGRTTPTGFASVAPIAEYTHNDGEAIIGGGVYRGSLVPALAGKYLFGDLGGVSGNTIGRLFYTDAAGGTVSELKYDTTSGGITPAANLYGYGQDQNGEIYAFFSNGQIVQVVPEPASAPLLAAAAVGLILRRRRASAA